MLRSNGKPAEPKVVNVSDVFSRDDLEAALKIIEKVNQEPESKWTTHGIPGYSGFMRAHMLIRDEIIVPILNRISEITEQEADPDYWAHVLQCLIRSRM